MRFVQSVIFLVVIGCLSAQTQTAGGTSPQQTIYTFTTIDVPGVPISSVQGINSQGDMVGAYLLEQGNDYHAFLLQNGSFTYFDYQGRPTIARGINDSGLIVGYADDLNAVGFTFDGTIFAPMKDHNKTATYAMGMNAAGLVVGASGTAFATKGLESKAGRFKSVTPPGDWVYVYATGVNKFNQVVGWNDYHGFLYANGTYTVIVYPGSTEGEAWGINDRHQIVGWYDLGSNETYGFIYANGRYAQVNYPGALGTFPRGIDNAGQIVGEYTFDYQEIHGFLATPTP